MKTTYYSPEANILDAKIARSFFLIRLASYSAVALIAAAGVLICA